MPRHYRRYAHHRGRGMMRRTRHVHSRSVTNYVRYVHNCMYRNTTTNLTIPAGGPEDLQVAFWTYETLFNLAVSDSIVNAYCSIYKWYRIRKIVLTVQCKIGELNVTTGFTAQQGRICLFPIHDESDIRLFTAIPVATPTSVGAMTPAYDTSFLKSLKHYKEHYKGLNAADNRKFSLAITPSIFTETVVDPSIGSAASGTLRLKPTYKRWLEVYNSSSSGPPVLDQTQHFGYVWGLYGWVWPTAISAGVPTDFNCKVYIEFKEHRGVGVGFTPPAVVVESTHVKKKYTQGDVTFEFEKGKPILAPALGPRPTELGPAAQANNKWSERSEDGLSMQDYEEVKR